MTEKIMKPCPFCGCVDIDPMEVLAQKKDGSTYSYPGCPSCGASCPTWNDRVLEQDEKKNDFVFTKPGAKNQYCRNAFRHALPHELMERWVKCYLIGNNVYLGDVKNHKQGKA